MTIIYPAKFVHVLKTKCNCSTNLTGKALPNGVRSQKPSRATQPLPGVVASTAVRNTAAGGENGPNGSAGGSAGGSGGSTVAVNKSVPAAKAAVTSGATVGNENKTQSVVKVIFVLLLRTCLYMCETECYFRFVVLQDKPVDVKK